HRSARSMRLAPRFSPLLTASPPIAVDTVSLRVVMNGALVDSGGNAGLPGRQAHHTQAIFTTLWQHPTHPGRWMLPGICLPF
ncbi:MAG: hypothetical protein WA608_15395, partial [Candidatus Acidiferrales bacterium]